MVDGGKQRIYGDWWLWFCFGQIVAIIVLVPHGWLVSLKNVAIIVWGSFFLKQNMAILMVVWFPCFFVIVFRNLLLQHHRLMVI